MRFMQKSALKMVKAWKSGRGNVPKEARAYKISHSYDVKALLIRYQWMLQMAINEIWSSINWVEKPWKNYYIVKRDDETIKLLRMQGKEFEVNGNRVKVYYLAKRLIPEIPENKEFKRALRNKLMTFWQHTGYAAHYVDSAIRAAYQVLKSWKTNYVKGRRGRRKPIVKNLAARIKNTLFRVRGNKLILTVIPRKLYLEFDFSDAWFLDRVKGWKIGEIILRERDLILMFTKEKEPRGAKGVIGWDMNEYTMDGFSDSGKEQFSLKKLHWIHEIYHEMRRKMQKLSKKKPRYAKRKLERINERERNRARDFVNKLTTMIAGKYPNHIHVLEDLDKEGMYNRDRGHNRRISLQNWRTIAKALSYKVRIKEVDPRYTTRRCSRCGSLATIVEKEKVICRDCGLVIDRQVNAAVNIYLSGRKLKHRRELWETMIKPKLDLGDYCERSPR